MDYRSLTPLYAYRGLGILSLQYLIFTISYISLFRMEENLKQQKADIIKSPCLVQKVLEKQPCRYN
jgi:hypothetical protein